MPVGGLALIAKWEDEPVVPEKEQDSPTTTNNKEKNPSSKDKTTTKNKKKSTKTEKTPTKKNTKEKALPKSGAQMNFSFMVFGWLLVLISGLFYFNKSKRQNKFDKK
jgi:LPXTG-motif cell wall-anchored protein